MEEKDILKMEDVSYSYFSKAGEVKILESASCGFSAGQMYAIMGPSGSGKTTTLSLLEALDTPRTGEILFRGQSIQKIGAEKYRRQFIGIVFQSYNLFPYLSVRENVEVSMEISGDINGKKDRAEELLKKVGLKEAQFGQKIEKLSGGEQQRVAIARALAADADVILADEPTGNLDEATAAQICEIFRRMAHEMGKCVIVVTHSQEFAQKADTVVALKNRKLIISQAGRGRNDIDSCNR